MIIYVGRQEAGHFAAEVAKVKNEEIRFVQQSGHIKDQEQNILMAAQEGARAIIYNVEDYIDDADLITDTIAKIRATNNAIAIILTPSINPDNVIVRACLDRGIKDFIESWQTATAKKDNLVKIITGYYEKNGRPEVEKLERLREEENTLKQSFRTIGVAGACHRIGTTSVAIQICKYLSYLKYKACYIEMNATKYKNYFNTYEKGRSLSFVEKAKMTFEIQRYDEEQGVFTLEGVNFLYNQEKLPDLYKNKYDYFVFDYGVYSDPGFNKSAFLKDEKQVFVVGAGATEMDYTLEVNENISYKNADFIFNFTAKGDDQLDALDMIADKNPNRKCLFTDYTPNSFIISNTELYNKLFDGLEEKPSSEEKNPVKKGFFGRRKKK